MSLDNNLDLLPGYTNDDLDECTETSNQHVDPQPVGYIDLPELDPYMVLVTRLRNF